MSRPYCKPLILSVTLVSSAVKNSYKSQSCIESRMSGLQARARDGHD